MGQKTVLITGATGLLGKQLLGTLLSKKFKVYAVKRESSALPIFSENISWIEINSLDDNLFELVPEHINYVIHAAALVSYKKSDRDKIFKINTAWTSTLAIDARRAKVEKFVFISSISALGKDSNSNFIDETTPKSEGQFLSNYGKSKRQAEHMLWEISKKGLHIIIFNPSVIIGPAKRYQSSAQLFGYVSDQKPFYTKGIINYIDARDTAEIIVESLQENIANQQYLINAGSINYQFFFKTIAQHLKVKAPNTHVPKFMVIIGAFLENIVSKIRGKPPTLTMETAKMAGNQNIYVAQKAKRAFNVSYRSLDESVKWTVSEMKKNGEL